MKTQNHVSSKQPVFAISDIGVRGDGLCEGEVFSLSDELQLSNLPLKRTRRSQDKMAYPKCGK
jgi:hypothetical protein